MLPIPDCPRSLSAARPATRAGRSGRSRAAFRISTIVVVLVLAALSACAQASSDTAAIGQLLRRSADSLERNPTASLQQAVEAQARSRQLRYPAGEVRSLTLQGRAQMRLDEHARALVHLEEALELCRQQHLPALEAAVLTQLALATGGTGDHKKAFEIELQALARAQQDTGQLAETYGAMGKTLTYLRFFEQALRYQLNAIACYRQVGNPNGAATAWLNAGATLLANEKYREGLPYTQTALRIYDSLGFTPLVAYLNLGLCYDGTGRKDSALFYYKKALQISRRVGDREHEQIICNNLAILMEEQHRVPEAEAYYKAALAASKGHYLAIKNIQLNLGDLYAGKGDYKHAYEAQLESSYASDSFLNLEKIKALAELNTKFETKQLSYERELLRKKVSEQKYALVRNLFWVYGSLSVLFFGALIALLYYRRHRYQMRLQQMELEQQQYHAQMNPHFIFNCLNSIQHYFIHNDVMSANKYLSQFALLMRKTMENNKHQTCTVAEEIAYLDNYLLLEQMRFENKFTYGITCAPAVDDSGMRLYPMIVQPLVENAIVHGLCYRKSGGRLTIHFDYVPDSLLCTIRDNGIGRQASLALKRQGGKTHDSRGLKLVQKRLDIISKLSKLPYTLSLEDNYDPDGTASGTTVILKFPQRT